MSNRSTTSCWEKWHTCARVESANIIKQRSASATRNRKYSPRQDRNSANILDLRRIVCLRRRGKGAAVLCKGGDNRPTGGVYTEGGIAPRKKELAEYGDLRREDVGAMRKE